MGIFGFGKKKKEQATVPAQPAREPVVVKARAMPAAAKSAPKKAAKKAAPKKAAKSSKKT